MRPILMVLTCLLPYFLASQNFDNGFPFYLPPDDSTTQRFLPAFPQSTADSYVTISPEGYFMMNGEPVRFWGMNMAYGACFPDKDDASMIAARLRKMGVNLVRFTLMDSPWADEEATIFYTNVNTTQVLNFFNLDRLHYFVAQLKEQGIYVNLILHNARTFKEGDGVMYADSISVTGKAVTIFDRHLISLQKDFALQLLTPVNPYTGLSMAADPVIAMIEITNENTLYGYWKSDWLQHRSEGGDLIMRHVDSLNVRWNEFLQSKYASQDELATTWNQSAGTGGQNEQVTDGDFEMGDLTASYVLELHETAEAVMEVDPDNSYEGSYSGRIDVLNVTGTNWHIQFKQSGASLEAVKSYQITFAARSESARDIVVVASRENAPYTYYGSQTISLTENWQEYNFTFLAPENNDGNFRLSFQFNNQTGRYWFDNLSLTDAERTGILPGESLADGNVARMEYSERFDYSPHRMADNTEFYLAVQTAYFDDLYNYLKTDIGTQATISGSNTWSGISDIYTARNMDYINDNNTWDYIRYPGGWSTTNWLIENEPMVKNGWSTIQSLFGGFAIKGKPYIVSQYSHPFPNRYQVEMMPWMTAYGLFHDASAITYLHYSDEPDSWTTDRLNDYHSLHRNTAQMALSPVYAYAFRQGLVAPAEQVFEMEYSLPFLRALPLSDGSGRWGKFIPYNTRLSYANSIRIAGFDSMGAPDLGQLPPAPGIVATTDTDETTIDFAQGVLKTVAPDFISVCGFMDEQTVDAGAMQVNAANDFGVVSWLSLTDQPLGESTESMLVISSKLQNSNMIWDGITTFHDNWGGQPTELFPMQLSLELNINADYLQLYPLSETGEAGDFRVLTPASMGKFLIDIDQMEDQTVWYGIAALDGALNSEDLAEKGIKVYPNPGSETVMVNWSGKMDADRVFLLSGSGKLLNQWDVKGRSDLQLDVANIPAGIYFLKIQSGEKVFLKKVVVSK